MLCRRLQLDAPVHLEMIPPPLDMIPVSEEVPRKMTPRKKKLATKVKKATP